MNISVKEVSLEEYSQKTSSIIKSLPLWSLPKITECYKDKLFLLAVSGNEIKGLWVVPLAYEGNTRIAKRQYRFLPYSSPLILEDDNLKRREIMTKLFQYMIRNYKSVYLPMDPNFKDLSVVQSLGALVEWRHTHLLFSPLDFDKINSRLRNHIRFAQNNIETFISVNPPDFNFDSAIKGNADEKDQRLKSAINLLANDHAIITSAKNEGQLCAGVFMAFDCQTAYMMHSWQLKDTPRGTISRLIFEATNWTFNVKKLKVFDFEGSVINNIDYFFSGFNGNITPYGFIHWSTTKNGLYRLVDKSLNIDGRRPQNFIGKVK